jgi:hypothetical protein
MSKKLITTTALLFASATAAAAPTALADPNNATPASPGACNMVNASDKGLSGMMNDRYVFEIMIPLVLASYDADRPGAVSCP